MADQCTDTLRCSPNDLRQAMSIHTRKITDSCRDKDCIEDLPVYLTASSQRTLEGSAGTRVRCAELLSTYIDVSPVTFDRSHYCIDITFFYRVLADTVIGTSRPAALCGLAVFTKRVVLCGEESRAHIYRSDRRTDGLANRPTAVVEALDPMVLSSRVRDVCDCLPRESCPVQLPEWVKNQFDEDLVMQPDRRKLYVTLGQFSIVRLERDAQLIVPVMDYSIPPRNAVTPRAAPKTPANFSAASPSPPPNSPPKAATAKPSAPRKTTAANDQNVPLRIRSGTVVFAPPVLQT